MDFFFISIPTSLFNPILIISSWWTTTTISKMYEWMNESDVLLRLQQNMEVVTLFGSNNNNNNVFGPIFFHFFLFFLFLEFFYLTEFRVSHAPCPNFFSFVFRSSQASLLRFFFFLAPNIHIQITLLLFIWVFFCYQEFCRINKSKIRD